jgi:hypothetical protein
MPLVHRCAITRSLSLCLAHIGPAFRVAVIARSRETVDVRVLIRSVPRSECVIASTLLFVGAASRKMRWTAKSGSHVVAAPPSIDPQLKAAPEHHAGFFAGMLVGLLPGGCARREAAREKLQRTRNAGAQEFVDNSRRVVEPAPPTAPHHKVTFFLGLVSRLKEPADGHAEGTRDGVQRLDRGRGAVTLQEAQIAGREAALFRE